MGGLPRFGGGALHSAPMYSLFGCVILICRPPRIFRCFKRRSCYLANCKDMRYFTIPIMNLTFLL